MENNQNYENIPTTNQNQDPNQVKASVALALNEEKKERKKKRRKIFLIGLAVVIALIVIGSLLGSNDSENSTESPSQSVSLDGTDDASNKDNSVDAEKPEQNQNTIGDYEFKVKKAELCKDYMGKDAVLLTYEFTNNSSSAISFDAALQDSVYQDGIGLETAILEDDTDWLVDVEIKPGITKEVKKAYVLRNNSSDVEIEVSELFSMSDNKLVTSVKIK